MDVRTQILNAATRLMAAHGAAGTSLQDVADAVGLRKPSVLHYFASKDALRRAVIDTLLRRWNDVLPKILLAGELGAEARLDAVLGEMIDFFGADPDRARLLVRELLDRPAEMEHYLTETIAPWLNAVSMALDAGKARGRVRRDIDPRVFAMQLTGLLLTSLATFDGVRCLLADDEATARDRYLQSLRRIARQALFPDQGAPHG